MVTSNDTPGTIGAVTSISMASVANLEQVEIIVKIIAGIVAIVVGVMTIIYYHKKIQKLNADNPSALLRSEVRLEVAPFAFH